MGGVHDMNISSVFVHSGEVAGGFWRTLAHSEKDCNYLERDEGYLRRMQRVFQSAQLGAERV